MRKCATRLVNLKKKGRSLQYWARGFNAACKKNDVVVLLQLIRGFCCKHNQNNVKVYSAINSIRALFINYQKAELSNDDYLEEFQAQVATPDDYNANTLEWIPYLLEDE